MLRLEKSFPLAAFATFLIIAALVMGILAQNRRSAERALREQLLIAAAMASKDFTASELAAVQGSDDVLSPQYADIVRRLNDVRESVPEISYAYILRRSQYPEFLEFVADADSLKSPEELDVNHDGTIAPEEEASHPGDLYDIRDISLLQDRAFREATVDEDITVDQWGELISGYAPIFDENGGATAIVGIDMDAKAFLARTRDTLPVGMLIGMLLVSGGTVLWLLRSLRREGESRRMLVTLLGNLPGMAYRCRNDDRWTMELISDGVESLTGYRTEELRDNATVSYVELIHEDDRTAVWEEVQRAVKAKEQFVLTYRIRTKNASTKWVREQGCGVYGTRGELIALEGFITDITEERAAEIMKSEFLGASAQQLMLPVTSIQMALRALDETAVGQRSSVFTGMIAEALSHTKRLETAITLMMRLASIKAGKVRPAFTPTSIRTVLNDVLAEYADLMKEKNQTAHVACDDSVFALTDASILIQILSPIVHNAVLFSPKGAAVRLEALNNDSGVLIAVRDEGPGISAPDTGKMFQPFFRSESAQLLHFEGIGLSLHLAQCLADLLHTRIECASDDRGSTFRFTLHRE